MNNRVIYIDNEGRHLFSGAPDCSVAIKLRRASTAEAPVEPPFDHAAWNGEAWELEKKRSQREALRVIARKGPGFREQLNVLWAWAEMQGLQSDKHAEPGTAEEMLHRVNETNQKLKQPRNID